jgi:hypothetical protein
LTERRIDAHLLRRRLPDAAGIDAADRSKLLACGATCRADIDAIQHGIQHCGLASGQDLVELFGQAVVEEVGDVEIDRTVVLSHERTDVTEIRCQIVPEAVSDRECQILNVR